MAAFTNCQCCPFPQLKKQQQLQQQILLQHFQAQQQQLAEQHEHQLRQHLKFWEQQRALEEQQQQQQQAAVAREARERRERERERLDVLRKKDKHDHSAVASTEVKQKLQVFLMKKAAASANGTVPGSPYRNWGVVKSSSGESITSGVSNSHPYRLPQQQQPPVLSKYDSSDFPLRKTASEPNLLKLRLKQRVAERRPSPMARRQDRLLKHHRKLPHHSTIRSATNCGTSGSSNPDSGPNSPGAAIREEGEPDSSEGRQGRATGAQDLQLFSSPSLPNISLGRPHVPTTEPSMLATVSEAEVRAAFTARLGVPLTEGMLPPSLPYYPMLPAEPYHKPPPHQPMPPQPSQPITDIQVAHARLNKRPLGRTQSAPLPLGHPMLVGTSQPQDLTPGHHYYLKQQIRQTVLTRAGAREASQLDEREETAEVIDLTDKKAKAANEEDEVEQPTFMQQQRSMIMRHTLHAASDEAAMRGRPLCRALSSPLVHLGPPQLSQAPSSPTSPMETGVNLTISRSTPTTGLAYDNLMLKHACVCGDNAVHPEHGGRLQSVWARLLETGLVARCERLRSRKATLEELQTCHQEAHTLLFGTNPLNRQKLDMSKLSALPMKSFVRLPCGGVGVDSDTTWNELHTAPAARMATGCVVDLAFKTFMGYIKNGFAVVRPPGHHAETNQAMGFCFFNSIAIAAKLLQERLDVKKILIVDWDVHHGNGTQQIFYDDPRVLYLSIHRHDDGNFFPGTGGPTECGSGLGVGYNVNIAWSGGLNPPLGDAEYMAAFRTIVMPIAKEFDPSIILVSCGFDAAVGHPPPLGGYKVSPACFGQMTKELLQVADGKVVLALEGGYDLPAICDCAQECVRALLGDELTAAPQDDKPPAQCAIDTLQKTIAIQLSHWPCLKQTAALLSSLGGAQSERDAADTVNAMASLSMHHQHHATLTPEHSHEEVEEPMDQDEAK